MLQSALLNIVVELILSGMYVRYGMSKNIIAAQVNNLIATFVHLGEKMFAGWYDLHTAEVEAQNLASIARSSRSGAHDVDMETREWYTVTQDLSVAMKTLDLMQQIDEGCTTGSTTSKNDEPRRTEGRPGGNVPGS